MSYLRIIKNKFYYQMFNLNGLLLNVFDPYMHHKFIRLHRFVHFFTKSGFHRFVKKLHKFCVMVNMNDINMYSIF